MDPIANLDEQRLLATLLAESTDEDPPHPEDAARLAELMLALDTWRLQGGFDPYIVARAPR